MSVSSYVFLLAVVLRSAAAAVRGSGTAIGPAVAGWLLVGAAGWAAASAAGAWTPIWIGLAAATLGLAAGAGVTRRRAERGRLTAPVATVFVLGDLGVLVACLALATPAVGLAVLWPAAAAHLAALWPVAAAYLAVGVALDRVAARASRLARFLLAVSPLLLFGLAQLSSTRPATMARLFGDVFLQEASPNLAMTAVPRGRRVDLETGAVAWLERPPTSGRTRGALVFHGADNAGSAQAATVALRLALLDAGYVVMSVDHPGFGRSPSVPAAASLQDWDPLPTAIAAYRRLTDVGRVRGVIAVGHSMGSTDVLRLIAAQPDIDAAFVFGAGGFPPPKEHEYHFYRFNVDRRLPDWLDRKRTLEVRRLYYDNERAARALPADHPPVVFAVFEEDWGNLEATRDRVFHLIPGAKLHHRVRSPHYFDTRTLEGVFFGDLRPTRQVAALFRDWPRLLRSSS